MRGVFLSLFCSLGAWRMTLRSHAGTILWSPVENRRQTERLTTKAMILIDYRNGRTLYRMSQSKSNSTVACGWCTPGSPSRQRKAWRFIQSRLCTPIVESCPEPIAWNLSLADCWHHQLVRGYPARFTLCFNRDDDGTASEFVNYRTKVWASTYL